MKDLNINQQKRSFSQVVELFEAGEYKSAFQGFVALYHDGVQCDRITEILMEAFYLPNEPELRKQYEKNIISLKKYPYCLDKTFCSFEELPIRLFPLNDDEFYIFDVAANHFTEIYDAKSDTQLRYFFSDLDKPLFVENETNEYNLQFLFDNVRRSEDYAGDNHIYLYYTSYNILSRLLQTIDLEPLLTNNKFIFLVGEDNKTLYPMDFKTKFNIDYSKMEIQPLRIEEIKRLIFFCKHACYGASLISPILGNNKVVGGFFVGHWLFTELMNNGEYQKCIQWINQGYAISRDNFFNYVEKYAECLTKTSKAYWCKVPKNKEYLNFNIFFRKLKLISVNQYTFTAKQALSAVFIARNSLEADVYNQRISPSIFFDPHMFGYGEEFKITKYFEYAIPFGIVRNPISGIGSAIKQNLLNYPNCVRLFLIPQWVHTLCITDEYKKKYCVCRFEDVKLNTVNTLKAVCKELMIPFDDNMLQEDAVITTAYQKLSTFDSASVNRDYSEFFSDFDLIRLKMLFAPFNSYFGYEAFDFDYYKVPKNIIASLFELPFKFETHPDFVYSESKKELENLIAKTAKTVIYSKKNDYLYPKLIKPIEDADS